jgi:transposase
MRGSDERSGSLFSYVDIEARVPSTHPLRHIRDLVNGAFAKLDRKFEMLYSADGRPSIPECLVRASLLQLFYSIQL